jgi:hypothetical protein
MRSIHLFQALVRGDGEFEGGFWRGGESDGGTCCKGRVDAVRVECGEFGAE